MVTHHTASLTTAIGCGRASERAKRPRQAQPLLAVGHRGHRPAQRRIPRHRPAGVFPVPRDPAARRTEPGMLTPRLERRTALLTVADVRHHAMLRTPARPGKNAR